MGTRRRTRPARALLLTAMAAAGVVQAADPPSLPQDFLEYLGSWEAEDGDWLVANAAVATPPSLRTIGPAAASPTRPAGAEQSGAQAPARTERKP
jgi:hypothetical protein